MFLQGIASSPCHIVGLFQRASCSFTVVLYILLEVLGPQQDRSRFQQPKMSQTNHYHKSHIFMLLP